MKCPQCRDILFAVERDGVEVDVCGACRGIWLDKGELDILFDDPNAARDFLSALKPSDAPHPSKSCPICSKHMTAVQSSWDPTIVLDECPAKDGLWFDRGELERVLRAGGAGGGAEKVRGFLAGIFAAAALLFASGSAWLGLVSDAHAIPTGIGSEQFPLGTDAGDDFTVQSGGSALLTVEGDTGRVGISDSSPDGKLDVTVGASDNVPAVVIDQAANQIALDIDTESTGADIIDIASSTLTTGNLFQGTVTNALTTETAFIKSDLTATTAGSN